MNSLLIESIKRYKSVERLDLIKLFILLCYEPIDTESTNYNVQLNNYKDERSEYNPVAFKKMLEKTEFKELRILSYIVNSNMDLINTISLENSINKNSEYNITINNLTCKGFIILDNKNTKLGNKNIIELVVVVELADMFRTILFNEKIREELVYVQVERARILSNKVISVTEESNTSKQTGIGTNLNIPLSFNSNIEYKSINLLYLCDRICDISNSIHTVYKYRIFKNNVSKYNILSFIDELSDSFNFKYDLL